MRVRTCGRRQALRAPLIWGTWVGGRRSATLGAPWAAAAGPRPLRKLDAEPASRCWRPLPAGTSQDADRGAVRLPGHQGKLQGCHKCPMAGPGASRAPPSPLLASPPEPHPAFPPPDPAPQLLKGKGTAAKTAAKPAAKPAPKPAVKKAAPSRGSGTERSGGAGYRQYSGEAACEGCAAREQSRAALSRPDRARWAGPWTLPAPKRPRLAAHNRENRAASAPSGLGRLPPPPPPAHCRARCPPCRRCPLAAQHRAPGLAGRQPARRPRL